MLSVADYMIPNQQKENWEHMKSKLHLQKSKDGGNSLKQWLEENKFHFDTNAFKKDNHHSTFARWQDSVH